MPSARSTLLGLLLAGACAGREPWETTEPPTADTGGSGTSSSTSTHPTGPIQGPEPTQGTGEVETCADTAPPLTWAVDFSTVGIYAWGGPSQEYGVDVNYTKVSGPGAALSSTLPNVPIVYPFEDGDLEKSKANLDAMLAGWDLDEVEYIFLGEEHTTYEADLLGGLYDHIKSAWPAAPPVIQWMTPPNVEPATFIPADGWVLDTYGVDGETYRRWVMKHVVTGGRVFLCIWASGEGAGYGDFAAMSPSSEDHVAIAREFNLPMFLFAVDWDGSSVLAWWYSEDEDVGRWRDWYEALRQELAVVDTTTLPEASANHSFADSRAIAGDELGTFSFSEPFSTPDFIDEATLTGFLNLRWDPTAGALWVEPRPGLANQSCESSLTWAFNAETDVTEIAATLSGELDGEVTLTLGLSTDGKTWTEASAAVGGPASLAVEGPEEAVSAFYVRVTATVPPGGDAGVLLDALDVTAKVRSPEPGLDLVLVGGTATWNEDFASQAYLHEAVIENADELTWQEADQVTLTSLSGATNYATLTYEVRIDTPVTTITAGYGVGYANLQNWASYNTVTIVDGRSGATASDSTASYGAYTDVNRSYLGPISATLTLPEPTTTVTVAYGLYSLSAVANAYYTNAVDDLAITVTE